MEASRTLTAYRAVALSHLGKMGDKLFAYPQYYRSDGLFFETDSLHTLRYTNDSIYYLLGARPYTGEDRMVSCGTSATRERENIRRWIITFLLCCLKRNWIALRQAVPDFYLPEDTLPRYYREALVMYHVQRNDTVSSRADSLTLDRFKVYQTLQQKDGSPLEERNRMRREFGDTYWWYYDYQE